jgi:anaphase-promoting complex subunit 10
LVAVVRIRVYLDFELDESYTPTKMIFLAGMGGNDLVEFGTWEGDGPCGWVDVPLEGVGGRNGGWVRDNVRRKSKGEGEGEAGADEVEDKDQNGEHDHDPYNGNVLKAMVIQMRIMENHQNGKDTHVRGFQVFACDDNRRRMAAAPSASADGRRRHSVRQSLRGHVLDAVNGRGGEDVDTRLETSGLDEPDWMGEPVIR